VIARDCSAQRFVPVVVGTILSAVVVPFGATPEFAVTVVLDFNHDPVSNCSEFIHKFHGQTSTNPALFIRVPLDARVNDKSPLPFVGIAE
jgi:hypothetical protein